MLAAESSRSSARRGASRRHAVLLDPFERDAARPGPGRRDRAPLPDRHDGRATPGPGLSRVAQSQAARRAATVNSIASMRRSGVVERRSHVTLVRAQRDDRWPGVDDSPALAASTGGAGSDVQSARDRPVGALRTATTAGRSCCVDRTLWQSRVTSDGTSPPAPRGRSSSSTSPSARRRRRRRWRPSSTTLARGISAHAAPCEHRQRITASY